MCGVFHTDAQLCIVLYGNVVFAAHANLLRKTCGMGYNVVNDILLGIGADAGEREIVFDHAIDDAGVEIVARADGADRLDGRRGIIQCDSILTKSAAVLALCVKKHRVAIDFAQCIEGRRLRLAPKNQLEVLVAALYDVGEADVFLNVRAHFRQVLQVRAAEVGVVHNYRATLTRRHEQLPHALADFGHDGVIRPEEQYVVLLKIGGKAREVGRLRPLLVKLVLRVAILVEESERDGSLHRGGVHKLVRRHAVVLQKIGYLPACEVVAKVRQKDRMQAKPTERHRAIEHRAARIAANGPPRLKHYVEYGLSDSVYFSHNKSVFSVENIALKKFPKISFIFLNNLSKLLYFCEKFS